MGICGYTNYTFVGADHPEQLTAVRASADLLSILGCTTRHGRLFGPEEDRPGRDRVVLLSDRFWRRSFGADPHIVSKTIRLDGMQFTVLGVLPFNEFEDPGR